MNIHIYKAGQEVILRKVTKKYGCKSGKILSTGIAYTNNKKLYPDVDYNNDLMIQREKNDEFNVAINTYKIKVKDKNGVYREVIICTEGMISGIEF